MKKISDSIWVWWNWSNWIFGFIFMKDEMSICFGPFCASVIWGSKAQ